jgi:hypothetical protein
MKYYKNSVDSLTTRVLHATLPIASTCLNLTDQLLTLPEESKLDVFSEKL